MRPLLVQLSSEAKSKLDQHILDRIRELIRLGEKVQQTKYNRYYGGLKVPGDLGVDPELANQWGTSCLNLLSRVFGAQSVHYKQFETLFPELYLYSRASQALGTLRAATEDYEQGFLFDTRTLIEAEVLDDFLEQSEHLLGSGYYQPAAVVIGSVLEDGLRKFCVRYEIPLSVKPKLDTMNAELARKGVYNKLTQKRIMMLADIRNKAAHGEWDKFTKSDVEDMLRGVRQFMETHFA
jgi:hypothetical protein